MITLKRFLKSVDATGSIGLIIKKSRAPAEKILDQIKWPYLTYNIKKDVYPDDFLRVLISAIRDKKWLMVFVKHTWLPGRIYGQLRLIDRLKRIHVLNVEGEKDVLDMKLPQESRLVLVMEKRILNNFEMPNFLDIIGPVYEF